MSWVRSRDIATAAQPRRCNGRATRAAEPEQGIWQPEYNQDFNAEGLDLTSRFPLP